MKLVPTRIAEVIEIRPVRHGDARGWFSEVFTSELVSEAGIGQAFVQDNESFSAAVNTLRGIHYQLPPFAQDKIVRVVRGAVRDVAVDLRRGSPTFGDHVAVTVSAEQGNQLLVPAGFGHGFLTLEPDTHVVYKVTAGYSPDSERSIRWDDPTFAISWQLDGADPVVSARDAEAPLLVDQPDLFDLSTRSETSA